jgi:hypothetical protein
MAIGDRWPVAFCGLVKNGGIQVKRELMDLGTWSRLLSAAGVAAGLMVTPAVASAAPASDTCVLATPAYGPPTTQVQTWGCDFWARETVEVFFGSTIVARERTNNFGMFRTEFNVPPTASGSTLVTAVGLSSRRYERMEFQVISEIWNEQPGSQ